MSSAERRRGPQHCDEYERGDDELLCQVLAGVLPSSDRRIGGENRLLSGKVGLCPHILENGGKTFNTPFFQNSEDNTDFAEAMGRLHEFFGDVHHIQVENIFAFSHVVQLIM